MKTGEHIQYLEAFCIVNNNKIYLPFIKKQWFLLDKCKYETCFSPLVANQISWYICILNILSVFATKNWYMLSFKNPSNALFK